MRPAGMVLSASVLVATTQMSNLSAAPAAVQWNLDTLKVISEFANTNCPTPGMTGSKESITGSGQIKVDLPSLLKKFANIGAAIKGEATSSTYNNVTQETLADALKSSTDCKLKLIQLVFDRVLPPQSPEPTDSITIVQASMTRRGNDQAGYDPSQHYVHGYAQVVYTGNGPYTATFFTACLTNGSPTEQTSTCFDNSEYPQPYQGSGPKHLELGSHVYPFVVDLPGSDQLPKNPTDVLVMVCILDVSKNSYFALSRQQRFVQPTPVCDIKSVKFQD